MSYRWWSSCRTTRGMQRSINEDAYLNLDDIGLWVVADGMGGHARGDVASRIVIDTLRELDKPRSMDELLVGVRERLNRANRLMREEVLRSDAGLIMGSTVVALLVYKREWRCIWAGDSRAYLMRDGQLMQITHDHSVIQEMIDRGQLRPEDAATHPAANRITRAIGAQHHLLLDEFNSVLRDGDTILLCSDGLTKEVTDQEVASVLEGFECEEASQELVELALERGARDNVTVAVIHFEVTTGFSEHKPDNTVVNYGITAKSQHLVTERNASIRTAGTSGACRDTSLV